MLATWKFSKLMSPFSWLCLLLVMGLAGGIENFITIHCDLDQEVKNIKKTTIAESDGDNNSDPNCLRRGCEPARLV